MQSKTLTFHTHINRPLSEVFDFFSKAENLNKITPAEVHFKIFTPLPIEMKPGTLIQYQIKLMGISFPWKTEISVWNPPFSFIDRQIQGPYTIWNHEHRFESDEIGTKMTDIVTYQSKGWIFSPFMHWLFVDRKVKEIFAYREKQLHELFRNN